MKSLPLGPYAKAGEAERMDNVAKAKRKKAQMTKRLALKQKKMRAMKEKHREEGRQIYLDNKRKNEARNGNNEAS